MDAGNGLTKLGSNGRGEPACSNKVWISAAFEVLGECRDPHGRGWGKQLRFRDPDGRVHLRHVANAALQGDPAKLCADLADGGLKINRSRQKELAEYLSGVSVKARAIVVNRTGWHKVDGECVFALPTETIGARDDLRVVLDTAAAGPYEVRGSLDEWKAGVGALTAGHALPVFMVSSALAGPLAYLVGAEGGGVHVFGPSSIGKSAMLSAAASVWGRGSSPGYVRSWRATANGLEGAAASATDTAIVLDELGVGDARDVAAAVYALANGVGKARSARDGSLREPKSWRVSVLSSGEFPLETKLKEDRGRKARAGQLVRLLDISADRGFGFGAFDHAGGFNDAGKLADAIKSAAVAAHGTAGPEFVRRVLASGAELVADTGKKFIQKFIDCVVQQGASEQISRAAKKFALIALAGELAIQLGVTPWARGEARRAAIGAFNSWLAKRGGTTAHEETQAIEQVRLIIEQHGEARFEPLAGASTAAPAVRNRLGWRRGGGVNGEWLVLPQSWKDEVCAGLDPVFVARTLDKHKMLKRQNQKDLTCVVNVDGQSIRVYVLTADILEG
jgi:putative DNA primase/helicase